MQNPLSNKITASVVLVEPAASVRMMLVDVIRDLGFQKVQPLSSLKEALHYMEVEPIDWLLCPLITNDEVNALQILKVISTTPALRHIQVSLMIDPAADSWCLSAAFELGLLSWHRRAYVKDSLQSDLEELLSLLAMNNWSSTLTAAEYLRGHLKEKNHHTSRLALEQNLLALFPGSPKILLALAEAELGVNAMDRGNSLLYQAELIDKRLAVHCKRLRQKYNLPIREESTDGTATPSDTPVENILGIKVAVIIDPDTDLLQSQAKLLTSIGVKHIEAFESGAQATEWLAAAPEPDLVITEWRLPGLPGPVLIQRIRQMGYLQVPIIITSSLIKRQEMPLLREVGVDEVLEKPFESTDFYSTIIWAIQQNRSPTEQKSLDVKIRRLLGANKLAEAERLIAQTMSDPRIEEGVKSALSAEYEYAKGNFRAAIDQASKALKLGGDSLAILNLLGKSFLQLREFEGALRCFEKAHAISPFNLERLLRIAEINVEIGDLDQAEKSLAEANSLDPTNLIVKEGNAKLAIESGKDLGDNDAFAELDAATKIVAYMNNRAISLIHAGRFEDGIALYRRAFSAIPGKWSDLRITVQYNLGLAYARYGDYTLACETLDQIPKSNGQVSKKARGLYKKIELANKNGQPLFQNETPETEIDASSNVLDLPKSDANNSAASTDFAMLIANVQAKRGDIGCYLIYRCLENHDERALELLKTIPKFTGRGPINRSETFGRAN